MLRPMPKREVTPVRLSEEERKEAAQKAEALGLTLSGLIREAIKRLRVQQK